MRDFEDTLNDIFVDTFDSILKYEQKSLLRISDTPITVTEAHLLQAVAKKVGDWVL